MPYHSTPAGATAATGAVPADPLHPRTCAVILPLTGQGCCERIGTTGGLPAGAPPARGCWCETLHRCCRCRGCRRLHSMLLPCIRLLQALGRRPMAALHTLLQLLAC